MIPESADKSLKSTLVFLLLLLSAYYYLGIGKVLHTRPVSVHMWAMCDRGSVARNYAQYSMNFFEPRTHNTREGEGITGLEFPFMNYIAAICYKIFGFSEFWYRFMMLLTVSAGLFAAWKISTLYLSTAFSVVPPLLLLASPILTYYAASFIPDAASLGFILLGWWIYFRARGKYNRKDLFLLMLFFGLASLIKITALIGMVVMQIVVFASRVLKDASLPAFSEGKKLILPVLVVFVITFSWYKYASWLSAHYNSGVFLMQLMPPRSFDYIHTILDEIRKVWLPFYYQAAIKWYILGGFILLPLFFKRLDRQLFIITYAYWAGVFCFFVLMMEQFVHHDYYILTLLPALFFQTLLLLDACKKFTQLKWLPYAFFVLLIVGFKNDKEHQEWRYSDNCWLYNWSKFKDYLDVEPYGRQLGLKPEDKIISICDDSPNIPLYYLNQRGWVLSPWASDDDLRSILQHQPMYVISCDTERIKNPLFENRLEKIGQKGSIEFYRLRY